MFSVPDSATAVVYALSLHDALPISFDRELVEPRQHLLAGRLLTAPPGCDVRHHQVFREQAPAQIGQEAEQRPRLHHARRSEEHTSELQSQSNLVCRLLLEKKKKHRL